MGITFDTLCNRQSDSISKVINCAFHELEDGIKIFDTKEQFITIFGSARAKENEPVYNYAEKVGAAAAEFGYSVITGGGPGLMEAVSKGAFIKGAKTYGINIKLPHEQGMNPYISVHYYCSHMFTRKILLTNFSSAFIILPGGFGTFDELFEILTLKTTNLSKSVPIILADSSFWEGMICWLKQEPFFMNYIDENDLNALTIKDNPEDIFKYLGS